MFKDTKAFSGFSVNDLDQAREFYGDTLGIDLTDENGMIGLHIADGGDIMIYPKENHAPATYTILNFPVDDVDMAVDELSGRGVAFERYENFEQDAKGIVRDDQGAIAWFKDPAGNILSVIQSQGPES